MKPAVIVVDRLVPLVAVSALENDTPGNDPPKESLVVEQFLAHDEPNEFLEIEGSIRHVLCNYTAMKIDKDLCLRACELILRLQGEKFIAISASLEHVFTFRSSLAKNVIQFAHVKF